MSSQRTTARGIQARAAARCPEPGDRRLAVGVFFMALAVYLFTYHGNFYSNDERALFSGIDSFVKRGAFTTNQIYWDYTNVGMLTTAGDMVPNYEPAQMVAAIPFYLWGRALGAAEQGVMFFGPVVMAAAAALVYLALLEFELRRGAAALGALTFAFGTAAWPYSGTFFREPLTVLAYLLAFYALLRYRPPAPRRWVWPALAGAALGIAITTKQIGVAIIPSLVLLAVAAEWHRPADRDLTPGPSPRKRGETTTTPGLAAGRLPAVWQERLYMALAAAAPLAVILLLDRAYVATTLNGVTAFARNLGEYTTNPQLSQTVPIRMLRAALGLTISPYKGLFWFSPAALLGIAGIWSLFRRHPWETLALLGAVGAHILGYSRYNYWSGGVTWGSRYMLQVIPFLILLAAPVFGWMTAPHPGHADVASPSPDKGGGDTFRSGSPSPSRRGGWGVRFPVYLLLLLSVAIQILGVSLDVRTWEVKWILDQSKVWGGLGQAIEALYMIPAQSPVVGHIQLLLSGTQPLNFAWVQLRAQGQWALVPAGLALSLALVGAAAMTLAWLWRRPERTGLAAGGMAAVMLAGCSALLFVYRQGDARFDPYQVDRFLRPMQAAMAAPAPKGATPCQSAGLLRPAACSDVLLVPDPTLTDYFLNYFSLSLPWYAVYSEPAQQPDTALLDQLARRYDRIWIVRDRNAATDDQEGQRGVERYLTDHAYKVDEQTFGDWARLLCYSAAGHPAEVLSQPQTLGEMTVVSTTIGVQSVAPVTAGTVETPERLDDGKAQAKSGDTLQLGLHWRADDKPAANYTVFVQLLNSAGQVAAQRDRQPGDGLYPTASLSAGQTITDNLALPLNVPPGQYRLIAGLYRNDVEGAPRLKGPGGDFVTLATVEIH
jgi:hypothetical protein